MPRTCPLAPAAVDVQHVFGALQGRHGRMGHEVAEQPAEGLLLRFVQMGLAAEEDHLVLQQRLTDGVERGRRKVAGQPDAVDLGADAAPDRTDVEGRRCACSKCLTVISLFFLWVR